MSDIHSNYHAFKACYEDAIKNGVNGFIFLGDYVSDLAEPRECLDLLYKIREKFPTICLRGNRERYMLDCKNGTVSFSEGSRSGSLLFTYEKLREKDFDFFYSLKSADTVKIDDINIQIAHASMNDDRKYFDSNDTGIKTVIDQMEYTYLLTGHSHKQYIYTNSGKTIINPGSVGIPQGGTPYPKYSILEIANENISCIFREVSYDLSEVIHAQFISGLVNHAKYWAIGILYDIITGDEMVIKLLKAVNNNGSINNEKVWHHEATTLGLKFTEEEILDYYRSK